jgi:transposase, IS30 family
MNLTVLVERYSRFLILIKNESKRTSLVIDGIAQKVAKYPSHACYSITFDNGSEFANHTDLKDRFGLKTYFCDPGSPWQKGSVENSISRLHRYINKNSYLL